MKTYTMVTEVSIEVEASSVEEAVAIFGNMDWSIKLDGEQVDFDFIGSDMITEY
jgi:hypothetical protein